MSLVRFDPSIVTVKESFKTALKKNTYWLLPLLHTKFTGKKSLLALVARTEYKVSFCLKVTARKCYNLPIKTGPTALERPTENAT